MRKPARTNGLKPHVDVGRCLANFLDRGNRLCRNRCWDAASSRSTGELLLATMRHDAREGGRRDHQGGCQAPPKNIDFKLWRLNSGQDTGAEAQAIKCFRDCGQRGFVLGAPIDVFE